MLLNVVDWITNNSTQSTYITEAGSGVMVDVQSISDNKLNDTDFLTITTTGVPNHSVTITQNLIDSLNARPKAATDFSNGVTTANVGDRIQFGQSVGYSNNECSKGYWPAGSSCPLNQNRSENLPIKPKSAGQTCSTANGVMGIMLNGTSIYSWQNDLSHNDQGVWRHIAAKFEVYDQDICNGHALTGGDYHHHSFSTCMQTLLNDDGTTHSPVYGYAADGYPVYGPYHASGVLAKPSWTIRDYDDTSSTSGCGVSRQRTCVLVDQYDISKGITTATTGPATSETVTSSSGNTFIAASGYYFEDYYHDSALEALGEEYLDKHNGHSHGDFTYHYHHTVIDNNGTLEPVFPYNIGPTFYGELPSDGMTACQ
jgi:hypothetical protein